MNDLVISNPVGPRGKPVYKLWIDGKVEPELVFKILERFPERAFDAVIRENYTVMRFISRIDNVAICELVSPAIFVLQGDAKAEILYVNQNIDQEQATKLREFLNRVKDIAKTELGSDESQRLRLGL